MSSSIDKIDYPGVAGKCFLVTGASSGIGRECALLLDKLDAIVILNGRDGERLEKTRSQMTSEKHILARGDLSQIDFLPWLKELEQKIARPFSGIAHCAGVNQFSPLRAFSPAKLIDTIQAYTVSAASLFYAFSRLKNRAESCSLAIMTSTSARFGVPGNALYGAARAAMESLCRSFAVEFAPIGIRCNAVAGGFMTGGNMTSHAGTFLGKEAMERITRCHPLGLGHVRDAANALIFLLGSASKWITGTIITVDGGQSARTF